MSNERIEDIRARRLEMIGNCIVCNFGLCEKMPKNHKYAYCCIDVPGKYIKQSIRRWACKPCLHMEDVF